MIELYCAMCGEKMMTVVRGGKVLVQPCSNCDSDAFFNGFLSGESSKEQISHEEKMRAFDAGFARAWEEALEVGKARGAQMAHTECMQKMAKILNVTPMKVEVHSRLGLPFPKEEGEG